MRRAPWLAAGLVAVFGSGMAGADRPSFLVLVADDWSWPHAGALGDPVVRTPVFDRLVKEGVLFENAFTPAPSCTPSRHAMASGQYHWRLGDGVDLGGSIRAEVPVFADLLAEAGYRCGFSRKGTAPSKHLHRGNDPFGPRFKNFEEFLEKRPPGEPFCFWYGAGEPHRPYDWRASRRSGMDLAAIRVPGFLPDNERVRTDLGDYLLRVQRFDRDAGRMLEMLEKPGQLENTIVVMTSDNGMPFPRAKATLHDSGTRVPLVIRWGKQAEGGRRIGGLVDLTSLAPTFLEAAGLEIPGSMTGRSLVSHLTAQSNRGSDHVLLGMERHVYPNPSRAIRTEKFLYIRNLAPASWPNGRVKGEQPAFDFSKTPWPTVPGAFSHNIDPGPSKQWMLQQAPEDAAFSIRPDEELYDLEKDPEQMRNVAAEEAYGDTRKRLSRKLIRDLRASGDPRFELDDHTTFTIEGWTLHINDRLWEENPGALSRMLQLMTVQLQRIVDAVPRKALGELRKVTIWVNPPYEGTRPKAEYHPGAGWLRDNGRDPAMVKCVEVTNVARFEFENRRMPYLMLHELAHAYHDQVVGWNDPEILAAFAKAKESGGYEEVQRWTGNKMTTDRAYALANHKEYFAENTEALFGRNDFFPFERDELKKHDPEIYEVLRKKWGVPETSRKP